MDYCITNEKENLHILPHQLEIRRCGKEKGRIVLEGISLTPELQQKPYFILFKNGKGHAASLSRGFVIFIDLKNNDYKKKYIKLSLSFESIKFDQLRDAFILDKNYYLYINEGKIHHNNILIEIDALESKSIMILYAHKNVFDKYILRFSQNTSFQSFDYTPFLSSSYYMLIEQMLESINMVTDSKQYNEFYNQLKNKIVSMIKVKDNSYDVCRLNGKFDKIEKLLIIPYLLLIGGEILVKELLLKYKDPTNYLYLYALKHYVEHTNDIKFYDNIIKSNNHLKMKIPKNIIEKIARIIYLNKTNNHKEIDNALKDLLLKEEDPEMNKILLLLPFTSNYLYNTLYIYLRKHKIYKNLFDSLEANEYDNVDLKKEEHIFYAYARLTKKIIDIEVKGISHELSINFPKKINVTKAKIKYDDVKDLSLDLSYDIIRKKLNLHYETLNLPYVIKINLPQEFEIRINGKAIGKFKELVYEAV